MAETKPKRAWFARLPAGTNRYLLAALLLISAVLRFALALQDGQYFLGDETRYNRGMLLYEALVSGDLASVRDIAMLPEHALFPWVGAGVTGLQRLLSLGTPYGDWSHHPEYAAFTINLGAAVLSLFSVLNIYLVSRLARAAGASETESLWSAALLAVANTTFYHARHLLPYNCALSAALLALVIGFKGKPRHAFGCGLLIGVTYGLYNGYWYLVPVLWLAHLLMAVKAPDALRRSMWCMAGIAVALLGPVALGSLLGGARYWALTREFGQSVTLGLFSEGWSLPWEYLWHSEGIAGGLLSGLVLLQIMAQSPRFALSIPRVRLWLVILAAAYGLLVLLAGLNFFVVYGRTVIPFVPFLCLLGGWALADTLKQRPRLQPVFVLSLGIIAVVNFWPHFQLVFPRTFEVAVLRAYGVPKHTLSVTGSFYRPMVRAVSRPDLVLVNAQLLYPVRTELALPAGKTLMQISNPLSYEPYQYECHTPEERAWLRTHDISMRLIALANPAALPDDMPINLTAQYKDRALGK